MFDKAVNREFRNVGYAGARRAFPGFPPRSAALRELLAPRALLRLDMAEGDILAAQPLGQGQALALLVLDRRGQPRPGLLGLAADAPLAADSFESAPLLGWIAGQGGAAAVPLRAAEVPLAGLAVLKAAAACTVWAIRPVAAAELVGAASAGLVEISLKRAADGNGVPLPPALGEVREEFTVRRGTARAYELEPGEIVQIIDIEGQQCSDFMALRRDPLETGAEMMIDTTATRSMVRGAYPAPGLLDKFFDRDLRPMMNLVQDTCGRHDTFGMACTARGYEERGFPGHLNCSDNISGALEPWGVGHRPAWPAINFFWNTWIDARSHGLMTSESHSRPGDYVALRAMDRLVCVSTACPDDLDPINGWNPTDVHVRIYRPDAPIRRAIAFREKEDAAMSISQESAFHPATSKLTTHFAAARDLWAPVSYPGLGTLGEYWACRERATLQDMSSLRKYDIVGPDAERLLQRAISRDVSRLAVWRGTYALICDEAGAVVDDGTLFRLGHELFRWCCGSEESGRVLAAIAEAEGLQARIHGMGGALPNLALQGPRSRDILREIVFTQPTVPALEHLKWFGVTVARLNDRDGIPFMLARSGYTGELGYELFCARSDAPALWDAVMAAGAAHGIAPMGSAALETIRIEAGLAAAGAEFAPGVDAFEAGLGFAVSLAKSDFTGKAALARNARDPRRMLRGLMLAGDEVPAHGDHVLAGERPVGAITSATWSPIHERAIAMARIAVEHADTGTELSVGQLDGRMKRLPATVCDIPFFDPKRERARA
ncbi:DUF1989 domain-containing protein [Paralimibaculum aggregatum]|uniref:DUF1989 domain-containing protein n=1 Tax=Paralimibaculum aggregatum TaxID=3036245 RepID=A0ABQ6LPC6_9RHOB|nr:aminomethyltransferase family protein [Limibaculum sp. NKW23]GMG83143.1 DUF1989 domain-containing protein [Limibaculum sp. NKW23]